MALMRLKEEITEIHDESAPHSDANEAHLEKLFNLFRQINATLAGKKSDTEIEELHDAQTVVIRTAAALPARSPRGLLYKLALWRWATPALDKPAEDMNDCDALAYSAFRDLVKTLDESSVLTNFDKAN